mmetsp:Transcript_2563/g.4666  ORF Transcript_2563/g.4666 Transcript_2563/m.4666 type:complete len:169 (-) Transcript_2563:235-741(-)
MTVFIIFTLFFKSLFSTNYNFTFHLKTFSTARHISIIVMGLIQSKRQYQHCNDNIWTDTTVTVDFTKSSTDQQLESINFDTFEHRNTPSKSNRFFLCFKNFGNKFRRRDVNSAKKFDDIELDDIQCDGVSYDIKSNTFFGKLKTVLRPRSVLYKAPEEQNDDTHGLIV